MCPEAEAGILPPGLATMTNDKTVRLVDNRRDRPSLADALQEHLPHARGLDVATGFFEVGGLIALGDSWQHLDRVRVLMGSSMGRRTQQILERTYLGLIERRFDEGLADARKRDPLLHRIVQVAEAVEEGRIEFKVHTKRGHKFHAKAYVVRGAEGQPDLAGTVGSSNFTRGGMDENTELNAEFVDQPSVRKLANWFEDRWAEGVDYTSHFQEILERIRREYSPREVYLKSVHELLRDKDLTSNEWEKTESVLYRELDESQKQAYHQLLGMATGKKGLGGAFLCDGVGMGKTFVGLMLIERFCRYEGKRVALFAPKSAKESVWHYEIPKWLPDLGSEFGQKIRWYAHTDLHRKDPKWVQRFDQVRREADVVIVDESHYFRNKGSRSKEGEERSWYRKLYDLIENPDGTRKTVFLLTATPVNNSLKDLQHQAELFLGEGESDALKAIGIGSLAAEIKALDRAIAQAEQDPANLPETLRNSPLFPSLVVQRSRSFARKLQEEDPNARDLLFPERERPRVAQYSLAATCGPLLGELKRTFLGDEPQLSLSLYYPLRHDLSGEPDAFAVNRQKQLVGLIRTLLVKRLESSVRSFEASCLSILKKMIAFCERFSLEGPETERLEEWKAQNRATYEVAEGTQLELWNETGHPTDFEDFVPQELVEAFDDLDRDAVDVPKVLEDTYSDMETVIGYLDLVGRVDDDQDQKVLELTRMLREDPDLVGRKVVIFTEFAHTARYLEKRLRAAGIQRVESVTSLSGKDRKDVVARLSPFYNHTTGQELQAKGKEEIEVLVSTDMLAEGLNLHDATRLINYDIHWNPVQLIQRIGRVDRRLDRATEAAIEEDRRARGLNGERGRVVYWNFLPPEGELDDLLSLMQKVTNKVFTISATLGIQTGHLLKPDEELDDVKLYERYNDFLDGVRSVDEEMLLELNALRKEDPELVSRLDRIPAGIRSGRAVPSGDLCTGVFFCLRLPGRDLEATTTGDEVWSHEAGRTEWYFVPLGTDEDEVLTDQRRIRDHIHAQPDEARCVRMDDETLLAAKKRVERHVRNTHMKKLQVPQGHDALLITWMEVHAG